MADEVGKHDMTDQELLTTILTNPEMPDLLRRGNTDASRAILTELERRAALAPPENGGKAAVEGADVDDDDDEPHGKSKAVHRTGAKR